MRHGSPVPRHGSTAALSALARLFGVFRSKSEPSVESESTKSDLSRSSSTTKKSRSKSASAIGNGAGAESTPQRRFVCGLRDDEAPEAAVVGDDHNSEAESEPTSDRPFFPGGHTILKKSSTDPTPTFFSHDQSEKHATFNELVEVIEYVGQDVVDTGARCSHEERLHDDDDRSERPGFFLRDDHPGAVDDTDAAADQDIVETESLISDVRSDRGLRNVDTDGAMRNIFAPFSEPRPGRGSRAGSGNPERPKVRRVELSERISQAVPADTKAAVVLQSKSSVKRKLHFLSISAECVDFCP